MTEIQGGKPGSFCDPFQKRRNSSGSCGSLAEYPFPRVCTFQWYHVPTRQSSIRAPSFPQPKKPGRTVSDVSIEDCHLGGSSSRFRRANGLLLRVQDPVELRPEAVLELRDRPRGRLDQEDEMARDVVVLLGIPCLE